jgi:hypothetical protein
MHFSEIISRGWGNHKKRVSPLQEIVLRVDFAEFPFADALKRQVEQEAGEHGTGAPLPE